jgi:hypothetical protein
MPLNNITFNLGQGGLGRGLTSKDHISGLVFYSATLPSGFTSTSRVKEFSSVADAVSAGILNDYSDATAATGTYLITTLGSTGDVFTLKVNEPFGVVTTVVTYTKAGTDTTIALLGASIAAAINAGTATHGYTATFNTATLTLTAPKKWGIFLNSASPITVTITGTIAGTITQFSGGTGSKLAVMYYHISEFFRQQPLGTLFVGIYAIPGGAYDFSEVTLVQNFAVGQIRQIGVYKDSAAFSTADITALNTVCAASVAAHKELIAFYGADISGTPALSSLTDVSTLNASYVSAVIGQDGAALGAQLYLTYGKSITTLGATLGAVAFAKVNENIAWVGKFNISNGTECDTLAFANGVLYSATSDSQLNTLNNQRYIFLRKFVGVTGSYFNDNHACTIASSSYAYVNDNRTIQKATRGIYTNVVPAIASPIQLDADGTLSDVSTAYFTGLAEAALIQMVRDGELSGQKVVVSPTQNVLATNTLVISASLVPYGVARSITVNIGFNVSVAGN